MIIPFKDHIPCVHSSCFIADNATVIGNVDMGEDSSVWFNAILRGDVDLLRIGKRTNIQDAAILHCSTGLGPVVIGDDVTIGHAAVVHGCTVHDCSLIGIGAIVLDQAVVNSHVVVAAGCVVPPGMILESGFMYAGVPAKKIRLLTEEEKEGLKHSAAHYAENARIYKEMK